MSEKEKIYAVSDCLLGTDCKYNGKNNLNPAVTEFLKDKSYVPICPETYGGLPCPRDPSEIILKDGELRVVSSAGKDVTAEFIKGAEISLEKIRKAGCTHAILKSKSPSCGVGKIYDGTFSGKLIFGNGIAAEMLLREGIICITEKDL